MKYLVKKIVDVESISDLMILENTKGVLELEIMPLGANSESVRGLAPKQKRLFEYLIAYTKASGESPTIKEMRDAMNVKSINTITDALKGLQNKGYIIRHKHKQRSVEIKGLTTNPHTGLTI